MEGRTVVIQKDRWKETALGDSAEIYKSREPATEKEKFKAMSFQEKFSYFNSYYRNKIIILIALVGILLYIIYSILSPKTETILYAAILNNVVDSETVNSIKTDYSEYLGDELKLKDVVIDTSFLMQDSNVTDSFSLANEQKLTAYIAAGEIDIIIAPESTFEKYADAGYFVKLPDHLTTKLCRDLANSFYYTTPKDAKTDGAYGIYLNDSNIISQTIGSSDPPVLGILVNSKYKENANQFIEYLFNY